MQPELQRAATKALQNGLIEYDRFTLFVTFNIHAIQEYIQKIATKSPEDMDNDIDIVFSSPLR